MFKPVTAMDDLNRPGSRILVLENQATSPKEITLIAFPNDRGTLFYNGKLYDWFGREVEVDSRIKRIVRPFGHSVGRPHDISNYHDNFIVELKNGKLAVVGVYYRQPEPHDPSYSGTKYLSTGGLLGASPYLKYDDSTITYEEIDEWLIISTFLRSIRHDDEYPLAAIGQLANSEQCVFLSDNVLHATSSNGFFVHHITQSKANLIDFFTGSDSKFKKTTHPPSILCQTSLCNSIVSSEDGDKITAEFVYINSKPIKASLDADCLAFRRGNHLYWYQEHDI